MDDGEAAIVMEVRKDRRVEGKLIIVLVTGGDNPFGFCAVRLSKITDEDRECLSHVECTASGNLLYNGTPTDSSI